MVWDADEPARERVIDQPVAFVLTDALRERWSAARASPCARPGSARPAAGKTGTTNGGTDIWFVGYTPELVGACGSASTAADHRRRGLGRTMAAPVWARMMTRITGGRGRRLRGAARRGDRTVDRATGTW